MKIRVEKQNQPISLSIMTNKWLIDKTADEK